MYARPILPAFSSTLYLALHTTTSWLIRIHSYFGDTWLRSSADRPVSRITYALNVPYILFFPRLTNIPGHGCHLGGGTELTGLLSCTHPFDKYH